MNEDNLTKTRENIGRRLDELREGIGASKISFDAKKWVVSGERFIEIVQNIPLRSPLIVNGNFVLVYIKDHLFKSYFGHQYEIQNSPNQCFVEGKKIHFYRCRTLEYMAQIKRSDRYCVNRYLEDDKCEIDFHDKRDALVRLAWCQNCLEILLDNGYLYFGHEKYMIKTEAAVWGDSEGILDCVKSHHRGDDDRREKIRQFFLSFKEEKKGGLWES